MGARDATLERYDLVERIAGGGMGEVFRAVAYGAHGFSKNLAVKRILPRFAEDPEFERRFVEEAKLAVSMTHANIVGVLDFGHMAGSLYLAMEYIDGVDVARLLDGYERSNEQVPVGTLVHIATEVCKGLDFAHRRDVVHRDISPSNLLLSRAGEVKIADFGIARAMTGTTTQIDTTRVIGKIRYMSPEQIRSERVDGQSDIFALGIVLWELATREQLITARDFEGASEQVCEMPIPSVKSRRANIPDALDAAISSMLERDRDKRCVSARALLPVLAKVAYALDPVPTAVDVSDAVEHALSALEGRESGALDDAILAELGGAAIDTPGRVTRASDKEYRAAQTITIFRAGVDARGVPQWKTQAGLGPAPQPSTSALTRELLDRPERRETPERNETRTRGPWLGVAIAAAVAVLGVALWAGIKRSDSPTGDQREVAVTRDAARTDAAPAPEKLDASIVELDAAPALIQIDVRSKPRGATIIVNDEPAGETPAVIAVAREMTSLTLRKKGYRDLPVVLASESGVRTAIEETLVRDEGTVAIFCHPWANVYFRGRKVGQTPMKRLKLPVGSHRLTLENPVLGRKKTVRVRVPRKTPYRFNL